MRANWIWRLLGGLVVAGLAIGLAIGHVQVVRKGPFCEAGFVKVSPWLGKSYCVAGYKL